MKKLILKVLRNLTLSSIFILGALNSNAQMHCRSMLAGHLTPFAKDFPVSWAVEGTMAPGIMTSPYDNIDNAKISGGMLLGALDFSFFKNSNIYVEGGYKNWNNSELASKKLKKSRHIGIRQVYYGYTKENFKLKIGLHETKLGDFFLIDERIAGVSIDNKKGAFSVNLRGGSVNKNFARMGHFCANRHLYSLISDGFTERIGEKIGETNLAGLVINWDPNYTKTKESSGDEMDEFSDTDEFSDADATEKENIISNVGFVFYDEFGKLIKDNKFYSGALVDFKLPYNIKMQTAGIYQSMKKNNALVYMLRLKKDYTWTSGSMTKFGLGYIGKYNVDDKALFQPLFSNLFLGEVMRMDAVDFPLWKASIKHNFTGKYKIYVGLKAVGQLEANKTNELDIEAGTILLKHHLKITQIFSRVETLALPKPIYMARIELRLAF